MTPNNKPLSKEEILRKNGIFVSVKGINDSMDEYARQEAIEFFNFLEDGSKYNSPIPINDLYEKYLESKTREKEK